MKLKPLADRVVVISIENDEVVKGGIVLPTAAKEKRLRRNDASASGTDDQRIILRPACLTWPRGRDPSRRGSRWRDRRDA